MALQAAREIVIKEGIGALSARKITSRIGYTVGTLYQIFKDMDDLVEQLNAGTLSALFTHCQKGTVSADTSDQLMALGILFSDFVKSHPNEWDAVMSYRYKDTHTTSEQYHTEILKLFGLMENATKQFYDGEEQDDHAADMAMLWASLTGIIGIASSERQVGGSLEQMLERLIGMYVKSRA